MLRSLGYPIVSKVAAAWNSITGKPSTFPPAPHTHPASDITGLPATPTWSTLIGKPSTFPPSAHTHSIANITGLQTALDAKIGLILLGTATVGETMALGVGLGVRRFTVNVQGAALGDRLVLTLTGVPQNGSLQDAYVSAANTVNVGVLVPAVGINTTVAVPIAIYKVG